MRAVVDRHLAVKPVPLGAMATELGIEVKISALPPGISGMIERVGNSYLIKINRHETRERQRFTLAHEIAHYLLHRNIIDAAGQISDTVLYRSGQPESVEFEANRLAADIIMPDELVQADLSKIKAPLTEEVIEFLARQWQVSKAAMEIKLGPVMA
jgi:Zn-dependent peptidase ImmA (M78 family)